jgi:hypothetical protein
MLVVAKLIIDNWQIVTTNGNCFLVLMMVMIIMIVRVLGESWKGGAAVLGVPHYRGFPNPLGTLLPKTS